MARKKSIPDEVRNEVEEIVERFNATADYPYVARFRGKFLYLGRKNYFGEVAPICRLTYTGDVQQWEFAIYKYSSDGYDPDEWMFPGMGHVDGTVEGALKAGQEAYPD